MDDMLPRPLKHSVSFADEFVIWPPTTTGDDAKPSMSLLKDIRRILALAQDERHLAAYELYQNVLERLKEWNNHQPEHFETKKSLFRRKATPQVRSEDHEFRAAQNLLSSKQAELAKLESRAQLFQRAKHNLDVDDDWTLSQTLFGVTTYYRREPDGSLSIKLDGELSGVPLFEQLAVLKEVDLHSKWAPFCSSSLNIKDIDKLDVVAWFCVGLPQFGLARDGCFRAIGCDAMMEDGSILLVGQGVKDRSDDEPYGEPYLAEVVENVEIPPPPTRLGSGRMTIRNFSAVIHVLSPTSVRTRLVANVNPNLSLIPQSLLDFLMKKLCGVVLAKLQHAARKASSDPVRNAHARRMRQESAFYKGWLMPKFQFFCNHLGWTMPPVAAFNLTEEQLEQEYLLTEAYGNTRISSSFIDEVDHLLPEGGTGMHPSASEPAFQTGDDASIMSSTSGMTMNTVLRNNPISQYLRELEEKTQMVKARKIAAARQRAANRLKPSTLSDDKLVRLEELKQAKARRMMENSSTLPRGRAVTTQVIPTSSEQDGKYGFLDRLHKHSRGTRYFVTSVLVVALFGILHADSLLGFAPILVANDERLWVNLLLDIGTLGYLGVWAIFHCVTCYVSLVYAFETLELGMKTGRQLKNFYGATVRVGVAGLSGAIVVLSVTKALMTVWCRVGLWYLLEGSRLFQASLFDTLAWFSTQWVRELAPEPIVSTATPFVSEILYYLRISMSAAVSLTGSFLQWLFVIAIQSNRIGRSVEMLGLLIVHFFTSVAVTWDDYVSHVVSVYETDVQLASWRSEAINMARFVLSYTAVFLVAILVLFNASAKSAPKTASNQEGEKTPAQLMVSNGSTTAPMSSVALGSWLGNPKVSSLSIRENVIDEGDEEERSSSIDPSTVDAVDPNASIKKKRFHLRLRKGKKKTATNNALLQVTAY